MPEKRLLRKKHVYWYSLERGKVATQNDGILNSIVLGVMLKDMMNMSSAEARYIVQIEPQKNDSWSRILISEMKSRKSLL